MTRGPRPLERVVSVYPLRLTILITVLITVTLLASDLHAQSAIADFVSGDPSSHDHFGFSVGVSADHAAVGEWQDGTNQGAVFVFEPTGGSWAQQQKLTALDGTNGDHFGVDVAIRNDRIIVGAFDKDSPEGNKTGAAYVFRLVDGEWSEEQKLTASDAFEFDRFGISVDIDGDVAVVGAFQSSHSGLDTAGSAYVFEQVDGSWEETQKLVASDAANHDQFGASVSVSGSRIVIGARLKDGEFENTGAAYVFHRDGEVWVEEQTLGAPDAADGDEFGWEVDIEGDVVVCSAIADDDSGDDSGSVHVFRRTDTTWTHEAKLVASDGSAGDHFGSHVAISTSVIAVGAREDDDVAVDSGSVYVYELGDGTWPELAKLLAGDGAEMDWFGSAVAAHGTRVIAGAYLAGSADNGSAHLYDMAEEFAFVRGDGNGDGLTDLGDPIFNLSYLFMGGPAFCLDAQDSNDDGRVDCADPITSLSRLFADGAPLPLPGPNCGSDPTPDAVSCQISPCP